MQILSSKVRFRQKNYACGFHLHAEVVVELRLDISDPEVDRINVMHRTHDGSWVTYMSVACNREFPVLDPSDPAPVCFDTAAYTLTLLDLDYQSVKQGCTTFGFSLERSDGNMSKIYDLGKAERYHPL